MTEYLRYQTIETHARPYLMEPGTPIGDQRPFTDIIVPHSKLIAVAWAEPERSVSAESYFLYLAAKHPKKEWNYTSLDAKIVKPLKSILRGGKIPSSLMITAWEIQKLYDYFPGIRRYLLKYWPETTPDTPVLEKPILTESIPSYTTFQSEQFESLVAGKPLKRQTVDEIGLPLIARLPDLPGRIPDAAVVFRYKPSEE